MVHLQDNGFEVTPVDVQDLRPVKAEHGITANLEACHTAVIEGYVVEGHVPAPTIRRLLAERPGIRGLAVPGMPVGSPGMEGPNPRRYDVLALERDGSVRVYESH